MKTYNQFITELNKFELAMKAGSISDTSSTELLSWNIESFDEHIITFKTKYLEPL